MKLDKNQQAFLSLIQAGLWEKDIQLFLCEVVDFQEIYRLAEEQSLVGLVTAGIEHVVDVRIPKEAALTYVGNSLQLEQRNIAMNEFVAQLIEKLSTANVDALLVKGQGIAQCYERPLWRASGDVDLFLSEENYNKAARILTPLASSIEEENAYNLHLAMTIAGWPVELHGTLRSGLWKGIDRELDNVQKAVFFGGKVRFWVNDKTQVFLPGVDEDVVFVFAHILQHFFKEGIGLRQICDWCRLLYTYKDSLNHCLLESRIQKMGVMTEWKSFAALAVEYLGMPVETMPFYSDSSCWKRKASRVMDFVLETGNFGHNRDYSYRQKYPYVVYKTISLWKHIADTFRYSLIFPLDSVKVLIKRMQVGFTVVVNNK